ncbi:helix-turn-helix domain-containing protein [Fastidiosibacter lacustris]|uniref:helix-turn-helix domain-containing protein n=1 Tax=Fastidiosibacter lacustris TaxID=2056695 RepID=UPI000E343E03|nr:helix-turn-helix domain-containing protein [Fastidiosibacter lacustris]
MYSFQQQLKQLREKQKLTVEVIATKMSFTAQTIHMLEDSEDLFSLNLPTQSLKNYYRKYAECLGMQERKIINILNYIDYLDYKHSSRGKMKVFDYINRLAILILIGFLAYTVYGLYLQEKANALKQSVITLPSPTTTAQQQKVTANLTTDQSTQSDELTQTTNNDHASDNTAINSNP